MTVLGTSYRLGSTSYVWPADILPNVRKLGPLVDDVELVLFEVDDASNLPDEATVIELDHLARAYDLTYTAHLPLDLALAHPPSLEKARKVIACTRALSPWGYVLHLDGRQVEGDPGAATLARWRDDAVRVLETLVPLVGEPRRLCVENLENYPPEHFLPLLEQVPVSLCIDVGHLWLTGCDALGFLGEHLVRTRVVHLHGIGERDHQSLTHQGADLVAPVLDQLSNRGYEGVLTLEVFGREDFFASRALVAEIIDGKR
ncbi:MAG: sugar phosphate isomerase/epimerase [Anaerolineae bacterium]|nr:sugar phosphate isomerase/epimerase [Anaerolineae bacterium]